MDEFREWCRLWKGFPGALVKGWAVVAITFVSILLLVR
jgi:hypothetical protein